MFTRTISLLICTVLFCFCSCKKYQKDGYVQDAGIVLTFDDNNIDNWHKYLPLFDSTGIKATFYVSKYNRFTADQRNKLRELQSHGHEIAFHSVNHYNMVDYVYKYKHSMDQLMENEILCGLRLMNRDGFYPQTFAYPFGAHCETIDHALLKRFKSVRALNGTMDYSKSLAPTDRNEMLYGFGLDKSSNHSDATIEKLLTSARENHTFAVLVAHNINLTNSNLTVTVERLKRIAALSKQMNLKFYLASEISGR